MKHRKNTWKFFNQNLFDVLVFCKLGFGKERLKYHIHATKKFEFSKYFCQSFIDRKFIKVVSLLHRHAKFVIDSKHIAANMAHKWWATSLPIIYLTSPRSPKFLSNLENLLPLAQFNYLSKCRLENSLALNTSTSHPILKKASLWNISKW